MLRRFDPMEVGYGTYREAWEMSRSRIMQAAEKSGVRSVCELGAGANPLLSREFATRNDLDVVLIDVSADELAKAPDEYVKVEADLSARGFALSEEHDLAFSFSVAEHIPDPPTFHRNVRELLTPGGKAIHFFSTLYAAPFVANRLLPACAADALLSRVQEGREAEGTHGKFRAYYRWCRGPTRRQIQRLESTGFRVDEYVGFFGHNYFEKIPILQKIEDQITAMLVRKPWPEVTSYACVVLSKVD